MWAELIGPVVLGRVALGTGRLDAACGLLVAQAWSASQGAVSEAVRATLSAAQTARANGQFAAEVMCLQTATQFGDSSSAGRLHQLCQIVEGPRARLAARFADAMQAGNARNSPLYQRLSSRWAI